MNWLLSNVLVHLSSIAAVDNSTENGPLSLEMVKDINESKQCSLEKTRYRSDELFPTVKRTNNRADNPIKD